MNEFFNKFMQKIFNRLSIFLCVVFIFGTSQTFAQTEKMPEYAAITFDINELSGSGKAAYQKLLQTKIFTLSGHGAVAAPYPSTVALVELLKEKQREKALQSLVRNASTEGQIYALLGLQIIKSKSFNADFAIFKKLSEGKESEAISSESGGCAPFEVELKRAEVIKNLEKGNYRQTFGYLFGTKK
jgi:hypothetical protein